MKQLATTLLLAACFSHPVSAKQPNIVFIFSDDHAPHAIGAYDGWLAQSGASDANPDFASYADVILYSAVDPSTGSCIALIGDSACKDGSTSLHPDHGIGHMLVAGMGEPSEATTPVRAALYGYSGASAEEMAAIDWAVYAMAGTNFVLSTTGYLESAMCQSYAKWVLDSEQLELMVRLNAGPSFDDLDEVLATMREVPPGGHFLGTAHTLANFQTAFSMPEMMNSDNYEQWLADGALSAEERAVARCRQMLDEYEEPVLPDDVSAELDEFVARRERELPDLVR